MDSLLPDENVTRMPMFHTRGPYVSTFQQWLNFFGCLLTIPIYYMFATCSGFPCTLDLLLSIVACEYNRWTIQARRSNFYKSQSLPLSDGNAEKNTPKQTAPDCMAVVVGYREDSDLFACALDSYRDADGCKFLLIGVDGDEAPDQNMVTIFERVYPKNSAVIHIDEPLADIAMRTYGKLAAVDDDDSEIWNEMTIAHCCRLARETLRDHDLALGQPGGVTRLCVYEPHMHKRGIMFTSFIFSIVIADMLGIEFLWSSDSDSIVFPDSLRQTISVIAADPNAGGASSGLVVHNTNHSIWTRFGRAVYWYELYLARCPPTLSGTHDCQTGPSAVIRVAALPGILYRWYAQTILGTRMIVNEDRHLTTCLLMRGWTIKYAADTLAATETPPTFTGWIMQQVRWARATHIETFQQPKLYMINNPIFFWSALKRESGPLVVAASVFYYLYTGRPVAYFSVYDVLFRIICTTLYNWLRNPDGGPRHSWAWVLPTLIFCTIPMPAIQIWGLLTVLDGGWGTTMRAGVESSRRYEFWKRCYNMGFLVLWMGVVGATTGRLVASLASWSQAGLYHAIIVGAILPTLVSFWALVVKG
ncbi:uncharacterized protein TRUGW13939_04055 [Talaromyces rugulosus]|uniref:Glycosyltransferase 2-like domain-containing protein n=1 Tax=Talaromyces rugulosus TaxID=121627 RepID=A0A7H8QSI7_TALRU|nr:uncharacterized protein TRUGW13939_04055 [Talaromyces rugulosus]QKX56947.1 hypothetical protein TRUGW13939_04055 [Talaromyces rugulosus]